MKKIFIAISTLLLIILIGMFIFLSILSTEVGYVVSTSDDTIHIISEPFLDEIESREEEERLAYLEQKADEHYGTIHNKEYLTSLFGTTFEKGDKVKAYMGGGMQLTAPGHASYTVLIREINDPE
ncbi:DUF3221 domain-containing protein [Halobacillus locisalis]|uniref:DUF3221 domain-containing protein n=1 Tax=Halobacillus locisalis TaxID=220753 RepID=A0A838CWI2_9BACI|nr:DUF3221 domain-containing protein [Halobacillus locisalis]MBA2176125.1 DUF3221 domain-containing protein [Halobacillus locisalis]